MESREAPQCALEVSRENVKLIKDALEAHNMLDKGIKITRLPQDGRFSIPLKAVHGVQFEDQNKPSETALQILSSIGMEGYRGEVKLLRRDPLTSHDFEEGSGLGTTFAYATGKSPKGNPLKAAIDAWWESIPSSKKTNCAKKDGQISSNAHLGAHLSNKTSSYTVYPPMLLLPSNVLSVYFLDEKVSEHLPRLYERLCKAFEVTHIAMNAPIPALLSPGGLDAGPNTMRSPTGLTPLYGDFGPSLPAGHTPTSSDFEAAFWCTTRQNGIFQTWAPRYTMFSRGNVSEKMRILDLATPNRAPDLGNLYSNYKAKDSIAVDLYAGIGYFAFSYAKAGMAKVLCWEINPWSVEGLKRGAKGNNWKIVTTEEHEDYERFFERVRKESPLLVVFQESNEHATQRIQAMLSDLRPFLSHLAAIQHVNCGYLPSSRDSWKTAVDILDRHQEGWIHVHENIGKSNIDARRAEIVDIFRQLVSEKFGFTDCSKTSDSCRVSCDHLERVKSFAPGVIHCVLDISIITSDS